MARSDQSKLTAIDSKPFSLLNCCSSETQNGTRHVEQSTVVSTTMLDHKASVVIFPPVMQLSCTNSIHFVHEATTSSSTLLSDPSYMVLTSRTQCPTSEHQADMKCSNSFATHQYNPVNAMQMLPAQSKPQSSEIMLPVKNLLSSLDQSIPDQGKEHLPSCDQNHSSKASTDMVKIDSMSSSYDKSDGDANDPENSIAMDHSANSDTPQLGLSNESQLCLSRSDCGVPSTTLDSCPETYSAQTNYMEASTDRIASEGVHECGLTKAEGTFTVNDSSSSKDESTTTSQDSKIEIVNDVDSARKSGEESVPQVPSTKSTRRIRPRDHFSRELCWLYEDLIEIGGGSVLMDNSTSDHRLRRRSRGQAIVSPELMDELRKAPNLDNNDMEPAFNRAMSKVKLPSTLRKQSGKSSGKIEKPTRANTKKVQKLSKKTSKRRKQNNKTGSRRSHLAKESDDDRTEPDSTDSEVSSLLDDHDCDYMNDKRHSSSNLEPKMSFHYDAGAQLRGSTKRKSDDTFDQKIKSEFTMKGNDDQDLANLLYVASGKMDARHVQSPEEQVSRHCDIRRLIDEDQAMCSTKKQHSNYSIAESSERSENICASNIRSSAAAIDFSQNRLLKRQHLTLTQDFKSWNLHNHSEKVAESAVKTSGSDHIMIADTANGDLLSMQNEEVGDGAETLEKSDQEPLYFTLQIENSSDNDDDDEQVIGDDEDNEDDEDDVEDDVDSLLPLVHKSDDQSVNSGSSGSDENIESGKQSQYSGSESPKQPNLVLPDIIIDNYDKVIEQRFFELLSLF